MIPELDVINNKVCPYCGKPLFLNPKYHLIYSCEECAITVGYDDNKWSFIRIPFLSDDMSSKVCEIRLDRWRENIKSDAGTS